MKLAAKLTAVAIAVLVSVLVAGPALAIDAPILSVNEVHAWRNIADSGSGGDLFILIRFELPLSISGTSSDWCDQLEDQDGCSDTPPNPTAPSSLPLGTANVAFYTESLATTRARERIPRVGHGLAGIYFPPGHGITWGDVNASGCVESGFGVFDTDSQSCAAVVWEAGTTRALAVADLEGPATGLIPVMLALQDAKLQPIGTYVASNRIVPDGQVFTREALDGLERVAPNAFAAGAESVFREDFVAPSGGTDLGDTLATAAADSGLSGHLDTVGAEYFGWSGTTLGTVVVLMLAVALGAVGWQATRKTEATAVGFYIPLVVGSTVGYPPIIYVASSGLILAVIGAMWWARKQPQ